MRPHSETDGNNQQSLIYIYIYIMFIRRTPLPGTGNKKRREMHIQRPVVVGEMILKRKRRRRPIEFLLKYIIR